MESPHGIPSRRGTILAVTSVFISLATISVGIRFWSRAVARNGGIGADDVACLVALLLSIALHATLIVWSYHGMGKHDVDVPLTDISEGLKLVFIGLYLFNLAIAAVKTSALLFYTRIFEQHSRRFTIGVRIGHGLVIAWIIYTTVSNSFLCRPISYLWDKTIPDGHCSNYIAWSITSASVDFVLDLYVLMLPMPTVWNLQMSRQRRFMVIGVFMCGYCCLLASLGRIIATGVQGVGLLTDTNWNPIAITIFTAIEAPIGIISICLPSFFYLFKRAKRDGVRSIARKEGSASKSIQLAHSSRRREDAKQGFVQLRSKQISDDDDTQFLTSASGQRAAAIGDALDIERGRSTDAVHMRRDIQIEHELRK